ncbi:glutathione S-transferase family protein [Roseateles sp. BYS87W]|uniref:Glutathione S-transferase family protein n=1 Tax=Pelomonas baiyunensis TaxID=3299026 RepID=A0ABW7GWA6_9BURK
MKLYDVALSGHAHRVRLMLSLLNQPYECVPVDLRRGEHKTPEFLRMNPFGQVPVLVEGDTVVHDSNAILLYLAQRFDTERRWWPEAPAAQAAVQAWFSVAAGLVAYGPAAARLVTLFGATLNAGEAIQRAHHLLQVMEGVLSQRAFLAAATPTLADVAVYSYVAAAPEGNVDLSAYPQVRAWLARMEALPGFVAFPRSPVGLAAA